MTKETTDIAEFVGLISMDGVVVCSECFLEVVRPYPIQFTESLADETVEVVVRPLLRTTFDNHFAHFDLMEPSA